MPPYKIGVGALPSFNNVQALNTEYYSQCLQTLIESAELCLDEGLRWPRSIGTEFDLENLLRMDSVTQMDVLERELRRPSILRTRPRAKLDKKPVPGGESPYRT
jgi:phage portal protein BeeE